MCGVTEQPALWHQADTAFHVVRSYAILLSPPLWRSPGVCLGTGNKLVCCLTLAHTQPWGF